MDDGVVLFVCFGLGLLILVAEVFLPSYGLLTIAGLTFLTVGIVKTFQYGTQAGALSILGCLAVLPTMAYLGAKYFHLTPIGKRIIPPNPVYTAGDFGSDVESLRPLVGTFGRSLSPLYPSGACEFGGRRIQCVSEMGMIESGVRVEATDIRGKALTVRLADQPMS